MNRLLVALLAAIDAVVAAIVGLVVILAPLTLIWVLGLGGDAVWSALWPATARIWQLGHLVPLHVTLPLDYRTVAGIPDEAATFAISLAPLAFALFTLVFAARSGRRAARAGEGLTGVVSGTVAFIAAATVVALTSANSVAAVDTWQAVLLPVAVFALGAVGGWLHGGWSEGDVIIDPLRERLSPRWQPVAGAAARAAGVSVALVSALAAVGFIVMLVVRGAEVIALFESSHVDALGATVITLGQLAYLPTLLLWSASYIAGPGFALGVGSSIGPAGTSTGVVPGIPVLGVVPDSISPWMLLLALTVVAAGFFAGVVARRALLAHDRTEPVLVRLATLGILVALVAAVAALAALAASGSFGPGRLAEVGPHVGLFTAAVTGEILIGSAIALLTPRIESVPSLPRVGARHDRTPILVGAEQDGHAGSDTGERGTPDGESRAQHEDDADVGTGPTIEDLTATAPLEPLPEEEDRR